MRFEEINQLIVCHPLNIDNYKFETNKIKMSTKGIPKLDIHSPKHRKYK